MKQLFDDNRNNIVTNDASNKGEPEDYFITLLCYLIELLNHCYPLVKISVEADQIEVAFEMLDASRSGAKGKGL